MKLLFIIHADIDSLLNAIHTCHNNPKKLSTTKTNKHTTSLLVVYTLFI